ncbi:MAG TPA: hypothetical protein DCQ29_07340 [Chitinophagaceae bacterium]|nr:hypothetical protein [Chitinophagaceae bacterium]
MIKSIFIITCSLAAIVLTGCGNNNESSDTNNTIATTDSLVFTMDSIYRKGSGGTANEAEASIIYPNIATKGPLADSIQQYLRWAFRGANTARAGLDSFMREYESYANDMKLIGSEPHGWYYHAKANVYNAYKGLFTLSLSLEEYSGGAHGNYVTQIYLFDNKGKNLTWNDVIVPDGEKRLSPILQTYIAQHLELPPNTKVSDMGLLIIGETIPLSQYFRLSPAGLAVVYNPYEIAAYAVGSINFTIPYSQLKGILKPEYL